MVFYIIINIFYTAAIPVCRGFMAVPDNLWEIFPPKFGPYFCKIDYQVGWWIMCIDYIEVFNPFTDF